jgi:hypothetical protein
VINSSAPLVPIALQLPDDSAATKFLLGLFADVADRCERTPIQVRPEDNAPWSLRFNGHHTPPLAWRFACDNHHVLIWLRDDHQQGRALELDAKLTINGWIQTVLQLWKAPSWQPVSARSRLLHHLDGSCHGGCHHEGRS